MRNKIRKAMTKIAEIDRLMSGQGIGWMETKMESASAEGEEEALCACAWVEGYILTPGGNVFCLEDTKDNYGQVKDGWGYRVWYISKPSIRQVKQVPWSEEETK